MSTDRIAAIEAVLAATEAAHGAYEATELQGVYDRDWAAWYAAYAVEHGIGEALGRPVTADELRGRLVAAWEDQQRAEPKPDGPWSAVTARQLAAGS